MFFVSYRVKFGGAKFYQQFLRKCFQIIGTSVVMSLERITTERSLVTLFVSAAAHRNNPVALCYLA